jgi:hypothetical protein
MQFAKDVEQASAASLAHRRQAQQRAVQAQRHPPGGAGWQGQAGETIMTSMVKEIPIAGADAIPLW